MAGLPEFYLFLAEYERDHDDRLDSITVHPADIAHLRFDIEAMPKGPGLANYPKSMPGSIGNISSVSVFEDPQVPQDTFVVRDTSPWPDKERA